MIELPDSWRAQLSGYSWTQQTIGRSTASVYSLDKPDAEPLFVKTEQFGPLADLPDEILRLEWMAEKGLPAPRIIDQVFENNIYCLLMSTVPGTDMASIQGVSPSLLVRELAKALRHLHTIPIATCPFDRRLDTTIALARGRTTQGFVDIDDFDDERLGRSAADVFAELEATRPSDEDLAVCHGDASLPNMLIANNKFSGWVDCARLGVADRHQDLALAVRSIRYNLGDAEVTTFLDAYGMRPDPKKMKFYNILDEFF